ncbi:MAG: hypothetical protein ACR2IF_18025 [Terriglobales bacterium]
MNRNEASDIKQEISRILWEIWDPIGVNMEPAARDEYDGYVYGVFRLLLTKVPDNEVAEHLVKIAKDNMGLSTSVSDMQPTIEALRKIKVPAELK